METNTTVMYDYSPPVPQTEAQIVVTTRQSTSHSSTNGVEKSIWLGVVEIVLRVLCLIFCLGTSVTAVVAMSSINDIDEFAFNLGHEYRHVNSYRAAAGWLILVGFLAVIYHGVMIMTRIFYLVGNFGCSFAGCSFTNAVFCAIFGLAFLSGGIVNAKYASDNVDLYDDGPCEDDNYYINPDVCDDFKEVYVTQAVAASLAFVSVIFFIPLFIITLGSGIYKLKQSNLSSTPYMQMSTND